MDDAVLRAPFAGIIAEVYAENYENIKAQETVVRMFATEELLAVISVPSSDILNTRQTKIISLNLRFGSGGDSIPAAYKEAVLDPDSATQTYRVKFSFAPPPQLNVLPGMKCGINGESPHQRIIRRYRRAAGGGIVRWRRAVCVAGEFGNNAGD